MYPSNLTKAEKKKNQKVRGFQLQSLPYNRLKEVDLDINKHIGLCSRVLLKATLAIGCSKQTKHTHDPFI